MLNLWIQKQTVRTWDITLIGLYFIKKKIKDIYNIIQISTSVKCVNVLCICEFFLLKILTLQRIFQLFNAIDSKFYYLFFWASTQGFIFDDINLLSFDKYIFNCWSFCVSLWLLFFIHNLYNTWTLTLFLFKN